MNDAVGVWATVTTPERFMPLLRSLAEFLCGRHYKHGAPKGAWLTSGAHYYKYFTPNGVLAEAGHSGPRIQ